MKFKYHVVCVCFLYCLYGASNNLMCSALSQKNLIENWAETIGRELWNLGSAVTNRGDIQNNYQMVKLENKDPKKIISEIVGNVSYMMNKKMEAVKCIIELAEKLASNYTMEDEDEDEYEYYRSNPPTTIYDDDKNKDPDLAMYKKMILDNDTHFFNLEVNTTHSSVHVPTNIYHKHKDPRFVIQWSEKLDKVFKLNYKADPALFWQYFGSSNGIMRHFPAMNWGISDQGLFDCRIQTWFIEAATCTKDVVILFDNSGSMHGMDKHIGSLVVKTVLDTLSNNDYINIIVYSNVTKYLVPCFKDIIVQATEENIKVFKDAFKLLDPDARANLSQALVQAFNLLDQYREKRQVNQTIKSKYGNQAIMIVSDGIVLSEEVSDVINKYNRKDNGTSIPIRIFTYLIGKEGIHLEDSIKLACNNRGFHSHVDSLEQVTVSVYKYVLVLARPLVLQATQHPLSWTHAYYDTTFKPLNSSYSRTEKYRLLTSVAGPAFNLRTNNTYNDTTETNNTQDAILLGVAGTDIPLDEIDKLMYPYKTGVNSHSFIVSNNGYVLKHPDLRPMDESEGILKENYNSIDLTEVEQLDDDGGPRVLGEILKNLREALVQGKNDVMQNLKIKYHYDDMRRISREVNDYYYAPIEGTPFTLGFAIPDLYGNYSIEVGDEIELHKFSTINISSFFNGSNWRIHPRWIYCKFHYIEGHEFDTPESELLFFINRMNTDSFKWFKQYEGDKHKQSEADKQKQNLTCGAKTLGDDAYYCDKSLMLRVVFDAKHTKTAFDEKWRHQSDAEYNLRSTFNATLRFVSTMSGLTRWEYISIPHKTTNSFGDMHPYSIDEIWYKSAVIQHRYNNDSFVYSVPFEVKPDEDILVTGSAAVFPVKDGMSAPVAVVGLQFSHENLQRRFFEITSTPVLVQCDDCLLCGEDNLDCYVIDTSGYVVISNDTLKTGQFFGKIDSCVMGAMINLNIFEKLTVRDYQATCYFSQWVSASGETLLTPLRYLNWVLKWLLSQILWIIIKINLHILWDHTQILTDAFDGIIVVTTPKPVDGKRCTKNCKAQEELWHDKNSIPVYEKRHTACEKERDLFILKQGSYLDKSLYYANRTHSPFYIKTIPHSNLILIAIKVDLELNCLPITTDVRDIDYLTESMFPCQKLYLNDLKRRPLEGCFNENPLEEEIKVCGKSTVIKVNVKIIIFYSLFLSYVVNKL